MALHCDSLSASGKKEKFFVFHLCEIVSVDVLSQHTDPCGELVFLVLNRL